MARAPRPWIVTPHRPVQRLEDNLWLVEGQVPGLASGARRMGIVRRSDGTLLFFHAIPLAEPALAEVLAWGTPKVLVVPHALHGIDAAPFAQRLGLSIPGPARDARRLREKLELAGTLDALPPDPAVGFESLDGTRTGEAVAVVRSGPRASLLFADAYQDFSGARAPLFLRLLGFGGGPKVMPAFRLLFTADCRALRAHLRRLADLPGLTHLVPCHGPVRSAGAAATLRAVADTA